MTQTQEAPGAALHDYATGQFLRPARIAELGASAHAARRDGGAGVIMVPVDAWILRDGGGSVTVYTAPGDGPEHNTASDAADYNGDPCDCFTCNATTVEHITVERLCYVVGDCTCDACKAANSAREEASA